MSQTEQLLERALEPNQVEQLRKVAREDSMTLQAVLREAVNDYVGYREFCIADGDGLYAHVQR
ncbi:MAG: hypothetical protein ABR973_08025 [Candidatus Acidiferrales bacterium]|jgi:hypothetical protein